jgi:hypothetical protein
MAVYIYSEQAEQAAELVGFARSAAKRAVLLAPEAKVNELG